MQVSRIMNRLTPNFLLVLSVCFFVSSSEAPAQISQAPLSAVIDQVKPNVVGISAFRDSIVNRVRRRFFSQGIGVFVWVKGSSYVLTNEHVIAIKDSLGRTVKYMDSITVTVNTRSKGNISLIADIYKVDEQSDLAALNTYGSLLLGDTLDVKALGVSFWKEPNDLKEGETILYTGYPYGWGRLQRNYPLSRLGMISQLIPGENTFLVDAFVQPGYSGSPVFVIREEGQNLPPQWSYYFVGIAQAYPYSTSPIYRDVGLVPVDSMKVIENPGFARVVGTHLVKRLFGLSK